MKKKSINLALQGGGSHGAFTWGVLDFLLEDGRFDIEGLSATSAGSMNAVVLAQGLLRGDNEEAREKLTNFWQQISNAGSRYSPFKKFFTPPSTKSKDKFGLDDSPFYLAFDFMSRIFSPYQFNPFNFNPLREVLESCVDFDALKKSSTIKIHLCATNVETCKIRIFTNPELKAEAVLASACLPTLFQAVEVDGEYFWDGGYIGNPAIFPLIYNCQSRDVIIVHINPIIRQGVPKTAAEILNRLNEVSFNSSLMREMRAIEFVSELIDNKQLSNNKMKKMLIHSIRSDLNMAEHSVSSKMNTDWNFLLHLRDEGRQIAQEWVDINFDKIGNESSIDIRKEFL